MRASKRGQVVIFVILGIVILVVVGVAFFMLKPKVNAPKDSSADYEKVFYLASSCAETSARKAVWSAANKGFYDESIYSEEEIVKYGETFYNPLNSSEMYIITQIRPIYLDKGSKKIPSLSDAEKAISKEFNYYFERCVDSSDIELQFQKFEIGQTSSQVQINEENVLFRINPLINFENDGVQSNINSLTYSLDYPLKKAYDSSLKFINEQSEYDSLVISYLSILTKKDDFLYTITYQNYNTAVFEFIYSDYAPIGGQDLILGFAVRYNWAKPEEILI